MKKLNNPTLTTDGDIKNLMDLCKGLDLATQAIKTFQSIKNSVMNPDGTFKATGTAGAQQSEALNNAFNAMKSLVKTSVGGASVNSHGSSGGGTSGGGGGGSSSTAKTAFDTQEISLLRVVLSVDGISLMTLLKAVIHIAIFYIPLE